MPNMRIGLYPGTFDPVTHGHMDVITRAVRIVDELVVGIAVNAGKGPLFPIEERVQILEAELQPLRDKGFKVRAVPFSTLLMNFVEQIGAQIVVRGLRGVSDFDYEFQMAGMNRVLNPNVETVCLVASEQYQFIASRLVKEVAVHGGDIERFVSPAVARAVLAKLAEKQPKLG